MMLGYPSASSTYVMDYCIPIHNCNGAVTLWIYIIGIDSGFQRDSGAFDSVGTTEPGSPHACSEAAGPLPGHG